MNKQTNQISFKDETYFFFGKAEQPLMKTTWLNDPTCWSTNDDIDINRDQDEVEV